MNCKNCPNEITIPLIHPRVTQVTTIDDKHTKREREKILSYMLEQRE